MDLIAGLLQTAILSGGVLAAGALGEVLAERVGVVNLGVEGLMALGAITGIATVVAVPSPLLGLVLALLLGFFVGMIFAAAVVYIRANQVLCGLALTLIGTGLADMIGQGLFRDSSAGDICADCNSMVKRDSGARACVVHTEHACLFHLYRAAVCAALPYVSNPSRP